MLSLHQFINCLKPANLFYYLSFPFIYLISVCPFPLLYFVSDILFVILYYVFRYRKNVVFINLTHSFPGKTKSQIKTLRREYFRYLCDLFLETFKTLTISPKDTLAHCRLDNESQRLLEDLYKKNENSILTLGHKGNWEWAGNAFSLQCRQIFYIVYHPLTNSRFDKVMYKMRHKFGASLITMSNAYRALKQLRKGPVLSAFVADQSPPPETAHWTEFLHQKTAFFKGPEKISSKLGQSVIYASIRRIKRGYYIIHVDMLASSCENYHEGEITERYVKMLEKDIIAEPEIWLWSHRRWKHKQPA